MVLLLIWINCPAALYTKAVQSGSLKLPLWPGLVGLGWVESHAAMRLDVDMVEISPVRLMEYQSADRLRPGIKLGVSTTPPEMVRAISGTRQGLLPVMTPTVTVAWL